MNTITNFLCDENDGDVIATVPETLGEAALRDAALGIEVFPCNEDGAPVSPKQKKAPHRKLTKREVKGTGGVSLATTDTATIEAWWQQEPNANIGIRAGDNFLIIDVDCKDGKDGYADLAAMEAVLGKLPNTVTAISPSKGKHYFFKKPDGVKIKSATKIKWQGKETAIDLRFGNAYVLAAPSVIDGNLTSLKPHSKETLTGN